MRNPRRHTRHKNMEGKEAAAAAEDAGDEESEEELDLVPMKAGDYMIHVLIEKGKNFKAEHDVASVDAIFQLSVCG